MNESINCTESISFPMSGFNSQEIQELTDLAQKLAHFNLEEHLEEVVLQIWGAKCSKVLEDFNNLKLWTVEDVCSWFQGLSFLQEERTAIVNKLYSECIDGEYLSTMDQDCWVSSLGLSPRSFILIEFVFHGWACGSKSIRLPKDLKSIGVLTGIQADLSTVDQQIRDALTAADNECTESGAGGIYGQLVVLGYKEYRTVENTVTPVGLSNEKHLLRRRKVPNGVTEVDPTTASRLQARRATTLSTITFMSEESGTVSSDRKGAADSCVTLDYAPDPRFDLFQIGRAQHSTNDLLVPGLIHEEIDGMLKGPVSRHACRLLCERLPPYRCFIFAGGFDNQKSLVVNKVTESAEPRESNDRAVDGFTTFGVKVWQPEVDQWLEVSVLGQMYLPRNHYTATPKERIATTLANQLTSGSVIDVGGGVSLLFQGPVQMACTKRVNPQSVVQLLNSLQPHCPVLMNDLHFLHLDPKQRALRAMKGETDAFSSLLPHHASSFSSSSASSGRGCIFTVGYSHSGTSLSIPLTDYSDLAEEARTYVFPACGHVHGYHRSMEGRPCPLCRRVGPFVPIALPFEPALCDALPTHVFNPCGHVASRACCHYWSTKVKLFNRQQPGASCSPKPSCPFCAVELVLCDEISGGDRPLLRSGSMSEDRGLYYSRLILQSGEAASSVPATACWTDEPSLQEEERKRQSLQILSRNVDEVRRCQQALFQREQEDLQVRAAGGHQAALRIDELGETVTEKRKFPKYLGDFSEL